MKAHELQPTSAFRGHSTGDPTLNNGLRPNGHKLPPGTIVVEWVTVSFSSELHFPAIYLGTPCFPFCDVGFFLLSLNTLPRLAWICRGGGGQVCVIP